MNSLEKWISYDEYLVASCIEHKLKNECKKVSNFAHKKNTMSAYCNRKNQH